MKNLLSSQKTKMALLGAAVVLPLSTVSFQANATAMAYSAMEISNFLLSNNFGGFDGNPGFKFTSAELSARVGTNEVTASQLITNSAAGSDDLGIVQNNTAAFTNNDYTSFLPTIANPAPSYAAADSHMTNKLVLSGAGANFGSMAATGILGSQDGRSEGGADNSMFWNFVIDQDDLDAEGGSIALSFSFDYEASAYAESEEDGESAQAFQNFKVSLKNATTGLEHDSFSPTELNATPSRNTPGFAGFTTSSGTLSDTFTGITAVGEYEFNIVFDTTAVAASVPEPGTLALLGLGILGLGIARRRRMAA